MPGGIDFSAQKDPSLLLLENATETQNLELNIQGAVGGVVEEWSDGATDNINAGNSILSALASEMQGLTGSNDQQSLMADNAEYQTDQTEISNLNNQYSNVMQGGSSALTNLTNVEAQNLQFCSMTADNQDNLNNLIMSWGN